MIFKYQSVFKQELQLFNEFSSFLNIEHGILNYFVIIFPPSSLVTVTSGRAQNGRPSTHVVVHLALPREHVQLKECYREKQRHPLLQLPLTKFVMFWRDLFKGKKTIFNI